jgi:hypothetical protein
MVVFTTLTHVVLATILGLSGLWFAWVPHVVSNSTYAVFSALLIGGVGVSSLTWRNAQATGSVGQLLHETELAGASNPARPGRGRR